MNGSTVVALASQRLAHAFVCLLWLSFALAPRVVRAEPPELRWSAPRVCPSAREVSARVRELLAERVLIQPVRATGEIVHARGGYRLRLRLEAAGVRASRTLSARSCVALSDTAAWLIALAADPELAHPSARSSEGASQQPDEAAAAVDPSAGERANASPTLLEGSEPPASRGNVGPVESGAQAGTPHSGEQGSGAPGASADSNGEHERSAGRDPGSQGQSAGKIGRSTEKRERPETPNAAAPSLSSRPLKRTKLRFVSVRRGPHWRASHASSTSEPRARNASFHAGVLGGIWSAGLPAPGPSLGARLGVSLDRLLLELHANHVFSSTKRTGAVRVRVPSQELGAAACVLWGERWRAGPCATLSLIRSLGTVEGIAKPRPARPLYWGTAGISAYVSWQGWKTLEITLDGGVGVPISGRPRFVLDDLGEIESAALLVAHTRLGVGVRFP